MLRGCEVTVLWLRAGIGVTADHLIVRDALGTQNLIAWPSVAGFDLDKSSTHNGTVIDARRGLR